MNEKPTQDEILTAAQVAKMLTCTSSHIRNLAKKGKIPACRFGSEWRFSKQQILAWVRGEIKAA